MSDRKGDQSEGINFHPGEEGRRRRDSMDESLVGRVFDGHGTYGKTIVVGGNCCIGSRAKETVSSAMTF